MKYKFLFGIASLILLAFSVAAQPGGPGGPIEPPLIPIDGGVTALLAAGALFGAKKIYDASKRKN